MYQYLTEHSQVRSACRKELHYFDRHLGRGEYWYRSCFPLRSPFHPYRHSWITGEATPAYLFLPRTPRHVIKLLPEIKCIAMLRNPVDRAFSHYQMQVHRGLEPLSFPDALDAEPGRITDHLLRASAEDHYHPNLARFSYLARGLYAQQLQRWFDLLPVNRLLVLSSEELFADPPTVANQVFEFLGLPGTDRPGRYPARNKQSYDPLDPRMRLQLSEYFYRPNQTLYRLLGRSFDWDD